MHSVMVSGAVESENFRFFTPNVSLAGIHTFMYMVAFNRLKTVNVEKQTLEGLSEAFV